MMKNNEEAKSESPKSAGGSTPQFEIWRNLTWDELEKWAGSRTVSRGRAYQKQGRVRRLGVLPDGGLLASVDGSYDYSVKVNRKATSRAKSRLGSKCSCPVGISCKHAAAAVIELLDMLANEKTIAEASQQDPRLVKLDKPLETRGGSTESIADHTEEKRTANEIRRHIESKSHGELAQWVWSLAQRFPEIYTEVREKLFLQRGKANELVEDTRRAIEEVTAEPAWSHHWNSTSELPDYAPLQRRLERLLDSDLFDELVDLGNDLLHAGLDQIGRSDDEGETTMALGDCMAVVFQGVAKSSLTGPEKLLYAIDAIIQDGYRILDDATGVVFEKDYSPEDWSQVADALSQRIASLPQGNCDHFSRDYRRDELSNWLARALQDAGRSEELHSLYEREARQTGSYERLTRYLIEQKRYEEAADWATEGVRNTFDSRVGIARSLLGLLMEIARHQKQWKTAAAYVAWRFLERPSLPSYKDMLQASEKARCKTAIQKQARQFLETGTSPLTCQSTKQGNTIQALPDWPLPVPDLLAHIWKENHDKGKPRHGVLLDIALDGKKNEEALHWYEKIVQPSQGASGLVRYGPQYGDRVAEAVSESHPERALEIYHRNIQLLLPQADQSSYSEIGSYLRKMKPIYKKLKREEDWQALVDGLRIEYRRRPRFVETLDTLSGKSILQSRRKG